MPMRRASSFVLAVVIFLAAVPRCVAQAETSPVFKVLYSFSGGSTDGGGLWGSLLLDGQGNLYGTTNVGGPNGGGTVFELTPQPSGQWLLSTLHAFGAGQDGAASTAGLIFDSAGNLYGTTGLGGTHFLGTVFELMRGSAGWVEEVLYDFPLPGNSGDVPYGGVVMDKSGNLYGTAGSAFELKRVSGGWLPVILHYFTGLLGDGIGARTVILDPFGNLYGTTFYGGGSKNCDAGCGTVFELQPLRNFAWWETILHRFGSTGDGAFPGVGSLIMDRARNLYGTTDVGGSLGSGTVFELTRGANGQWSESILHNFAEGDGNGDHVSAGVVMDMAGNLYGTTIAGGDPICGCGVVYKLAPNGDGTWTYTVLHTFVGSDGAQPDANLIIDSNGNLYGTTPVGGANGAGVVFEVTP